MIVVSLVLNILVLVPVCAVLLARGPVAEATWGVDTPARRILLAMYGAIGVGSVMLLVWPEVGAVRALLALQVGYKVAMPFTVGRWGHPVVVSNLGIAVVHGVTLATLGVG
jgi:hypothetical protein